MSFIEKFSNIFSYRHLYYINVYDTKEKHIYYRAENDYNGGRERVGMGVLMAAYLQRFYDEKLMDSLNRYLAYVERELYDDEHSLVANDYGYDNHFQRLYNYPWMSLLFIEVYQLKKDIDYLYKAYKVMKSSFLCNCNSVGEAYEKSMGRKDVCGI